MTLPTEKNTPGQNPLNKKTLLYGEAKVGKSTLVAKLFPNVAVFGTDPTGLEELEVFKVDVRDWLTFRTVAGELAAYLEKHPPGDGCRYDAISVDTVDELSRLCAEHVLKELPGGPDAKAFRHASDWEYGKAWNAINEEFRLRVAKLCNLGLPMVFVSHAKSKTVQKKTRTGAKYEVTSISPDIGSGGVRDWLLKFVDVILYAEVVHEEGKEERVLRTTPSESYLAGARQPEGRVQLPDTLPLDGVRLREALLATGVQPVAIEEQNDQAGEGDSGIVVPQSSPTAPVRQRRNGEPPNIKKARLVLNAADPKRVSDEGYSNEEREALNTISKYEASKSTS